MMHREHQDFGLRRLLDNAPRRLEAVHVRHAQVENDDVRTQLTHQLHRFAAIATFGHDLPSGMALEQRAHAAPDYAVIVDDHETERSAVHDGAPLSGTRARTSVPCAPDSISRTPPSCCNRSRMPATPTPRAPFPAGSWVSDSIERPRP